MSISPTAFSGQTPDEVYFDRGQDIPEELKKRERKPNWNDSNEIKLLAVGSVRR